MPYPRSGLTHRHIRYHDPQQLSLIVSMTPHIKNSGGFLYPNLTSFYFVFYHFWPPKLGWGHYLPSCGKSKASRHILFCEVGNIRRVYVSFTPTHLPEIISTFRFISESCLSHSPIGHPFNKTHLVLRRKPSFYRAFTRQSKDS